MPSPDMEDDYEAMYPGGWRSDVYSQRMIPVGMCLRMCPFVEMQERELHRRLCKYEIKFGTDPPEVDFELAVKEFKRSCVGDDFGNLVDIRPWSILKKTLRHLLLNICVRDDDWMYISDFVFDRLRAVRQDIIIQRIEGRRYIETLEGSSRFLIYSMFRLCCTIKDYTTSRSEKPMLKQEGPVKGLDNLEMNVIREMKLTVKCLRDCLRSLIVQYQENVPDSPHRPLFEAINLFINLPFLHGHETNLTEFQANKSLRNSDPSFKIAFKMYKDHLTGNHWGALKRLPSLAGEPLLVLAYAPALANLQIELVHSLLRTYSTPGVNKSSLKHLCSLLCPEWLEPNETERIRFARFIATQFNFYDKTHNLCDYNQPKKLVQQQIIPRDFVEKAMLERLATQQASQCTQNDSETRLYALQMILSKDWSFFRTVIKEHGVEFILDTGYET